jgi:hypothetical protein
MAQDWDIKPRGDSCAACQQPFADGAVCFSALTFGENGYQRGDFCAVCWPARAGTAAPVSVWQGVFKMPAPEPEPALRKETAESLLRKFMEDDNPANRNVIYILAVMLERNRALVERDVKLEDGYPSLRVYEHRKTGETFLISDPRLRLDQLESVQQEVAAMLGWNEEKTEEKAEGGAHAGGVASPEPEKAEAASPG